MWPLVVGVAAAAGWLVPKLLSNKRRLGSKKKNKGCIVAIAKGKVKPEDVPRVLELWPIMSHCAYHTNPGVLSYELSFSDVDPGSFVSVMRCKTMADLQRHRHGPGYTEFFAKVDDEKMERLEFSWTFYTETDLGFETC